MDQNESFGFVENAELRKNLIDSIKFLSFFPVLEETTHENIQEVYRTMMLYSASIIEALLLDYCKRKGIEFFEERYSYDQVIAPSFPVQIDKNKFMNGKIVLSLRHERKKSDGAVTFDNLLVKLEEFLGKKLLEDVKKLKDVRNTFHLAKSRDPITLKDAEKATKNILKIVDKVK